MSRIDRWFTRGSRDMARRTSRRGFLARLAALLVGGATLPLLPVARPAAAAREPAPGEPDPATPAGNPSDCAYWRHCAIDGFACSCCGGSASSCPPGTEMSPVTWVGTCRNPADGKDYIISYTECCGRGFCGRCGCNRNEGERPEYHWTRTNDINWCMGSASAVYNSTVAIVVGVATEP